jgi:hypothetical protein
MMSNKLVLTTFKLIKKESEKKNSQDVLKAYSRKGRGRGKN